MFSFYPLEHFQTVQLSISFSNFIEQSIDDYFINKKDKTSLFYTKSEQYQSWKLLSPGSLVLHRFRSEQVPRLLELIDD